MSKTIDRLNSFLRGEIAAVETHHMAIEKLSKASYVATLKDNLVSHEVRVRSLREEIIRHGGSPDEGSGLWGTFAKLVEGGAALFGDKSAIAALEEGEDQGRDTYIRELAAAEPSERPFIQKMLDKQLKTHDVISGLKKVMNDRETARPSPPM